jgi:hypothetical protein
MNWLDIGRREDNDLFAIITGARERSLNRRVVAQPTQDLDPGIVGKRSSGAEEADAVLPECAIGAGDRSHCSR